jgi:predicted permease
MTWWMRLLVRLYPREWRQRYAEELEALIEDSGSGWNASFDILQGAAIMQVATAAAQVRHHARRLMATPAFSLTAIATLAAAIGANTVIFSLVSGVLLKPLPFAAPHELVGLWHVAPGLTPGPVNQAAFTYFTYREEAKSFEDIGLWTSQAATVVGRGEPEELQALAVTDGTLPLLRVRTELGRGFTSHDDAPGSRETVILSREYWQRAFAGNPAAIGQSLMVDGRAREVIGVLPARFRFLRHAPDLILPLRLNRATAQIGLFRYQGVARLKPGVTAEQAMTDMARLIPGMPDRFPIPSGFSRTMYDGFRMAPDVHPLHQDLVGDVSAALWVLAGAVALLLLVAVANVANLFLVRGEARRQELAVQLALGAGLRRIAGQLIGESLLLSLASGVLGVGLAVLGLRAIRLAASGRLPRIDEVTVEPLVMVGALAAAVLAGLLFCIAPLVKFGRPDLPAALRTTGRGMSDGRDRQRLRSILVATQVAVAVVLLVGSALMLRTFTAIRDVRPGFADPARVLTVRISIPEAVVADPIAAARTHDQISQRMRELRGVQALGLTSSITMDGANRRDPVFVEGVAVGSEMPPTRRMKWASPGYFAAMGNPVLHGRDFTWEDVHDRRLVAVLSEKLARELFGGAQQALGGRVRPSPAGPWREVVGIVGNEHDDGPTRPATPMVYWPFMQDNFAPSRTTVERTMVYAIRTDRQSDPALLTDLQQAVRSVNPSLPLARVETVQEVYDRSTMQTLFMMVILAVAAGMTVLLGVVGLYGVIAYVVVQRQREVGIRMALGASAGDVQRLFMGRGLGIVAYGLVAGTVVATVASRTLTTMLFGVSTLDPWAYLAALVTLAAVAAAAIWVPARAATRVPPSIALRG